MAGGEAGVDRVLDLFCEDMERTLQLMGAAGLDAVKGRVSLRSEPDLEGVAHARKR